MKRISTLALALALGATAGAAQAQVGPAEPGAAMPDGATTTTTPDAPMGPAPGAAPSTDEPFDDPLEPVEPADPNDSLQPNEVKPYPDASSSDGMQDGDRTVTDRPEQPAPGRVADPLDPDDADPLS